MSLTYQDTSAEALSYLALSADRARGGGRQYQNHEISRELHKDLGKYAPVSGYFLDHRLFLRLLIFINQSEIGIIASLDTHSLCTIAYLFRFSEQ